MNKPTTMQNAFADAAEKGKLKALRHPTKAARASALATVNQIDAALNRRRFNLKAKS